MGKEIANILGRINPDEAKRNAWIDELTRVGVTVQTENIQDQADQLSVVPPTRTKRFKRWLDRARVGFPPPIEYFQSEPIEITQTPTPIRLTSESSD